MSDQGMVLRFSGYELDRPRAELRGPDGEAIKLRPKNFALLCLFVESAGRTLSKQELMDAIWPNVHVGDASLFQCIREIRTAIGDNRREMIKLVSGSGYRFEPEVSVKSPTGEPAPLPIAVPAAAAELAAAPASPWRRFGRVRNVAFAVAAIAAMAGVGIVTFAARPPSLAVMPITAAGSGEISAMAAGVTTRLADGLAKIENIHVRAPQDSRARQAHFVVNGELEQSERSWQLRARMTRSATGDVMWTAPVSVALDDSDLSLQQSRLAAGIGHPLARRINELLGSARPRASGGGSPPGSAKVVIEQATASIVQTSRERFATAQSMLEKAFAADPDNADLAVALAGLQLRGIQMVWYSPADSAAAEINARSILERALRSAPHSISVLEAYCRFLNATNEFVESLVACSRALNFDPWNGLALYHIGLAQVQLGRFEDALAVFKQADRFDTPLVSRWTWQLGAGMTYLLMDRSEEALPWLQRSISITPASGRTHMLLSAAYRRLGQPAAARAAMDKALTLRPGSNLGNVALPPKNASPGFLAASEWIGRAYVEAGLPER